MKIYCDASGNGTLAVYSDKPTVIRSRARNINQLELEALRLGVFLYGLDNVFFSDNLYAIKKIREEYEIDVHKVKGRRNLAHPYTKSA